MPITDNPHGNSQEIHADIAIIGAGPAGLIAAETLAKAGKSVHVFDRMPSPGRKFLIAGKGGLNLTHSEPFDKFVSRYSNRSEVMRGYLEEFGPKEIIHWAASHGIETFVGTSGRVFPVGMKAAPLLYAWKTSLVEMGVTIHYRHQWRGFGKKPTTLVIENPEGMVEVNSDACLFALGGASWKFTGSQGDWGDAFANLGVGTVQFQASNCGFKVIFSDHIKTKFDGAPIKTVSLTIKDAAGNSHSRQGEFILTKEGIEGSLVYALSATIRETINQSGSALLLLDLLPDTPLPQLVKSLSQDRGKRSHSTFIQRQTGLTGAKLALLWEFTPKEALQDPPKLAELIKALPIPALQPFPLDEAISSAGGLPFEEMDSNLMLSKAPGVFCAGEMLDWEAPTGGYLLTACLSTGVAAAKGILKWLGNT